MKFVEFRSQDTNSPVCVNVDQVAGFIELERRNGTRIHMMNQQYIDVQQCFSNVREALREAAQDA